MQQKSSVACYNTLIEYKHAATFCILNSNDESEISKTLLLKADELHKEAREMVNTCFCMT